MHPAERIRRLAVVICATALAMSPRGALAQQEVRPLVAVDLSDARGREVAEEVVVESARNETVGLAVRVTLPNKDRARKKLSLAVGPIRSDAGGAIIDAKHLTAYQVVTMPAETNRAEYVRHTGLETTDRRLPGALVPMEREKSGRVPLAQDERGRLDDTTRTTLAKRIDARLDGEETYEGRRRRLRTVIQSQARCVATYVRGEAVYRPWDGRW
jgi:hypothetical protein